MLSGETAMGLFPVETVQMMKRVILYAEHDEPIVTARHLVDFRGQERANAISAAAVVLAHKLPAKVIVAETSSGQTARNISSLRPDVPIIIVTDHERVYYQMAIVWGGKSFLADNMEGATAKVVRELGSLGYISKGDPVVVASGNQPGLIGGTSKVEISLAD
jgi:pyruvate kinase